MKKILHIITGLADGGAEAVLFRLCAHDTISHHEVISLCDAGKYGPMLESRGIKVTCLKMPRGRVTFTGLWQLWRLIRKSRPDVVQTWMYHADLLGGVIARLAGQRNIFWGIRHTDLVVGESSRNTIWVSRLCALLSRWIPRSIICCAERAKEVHAQLGYDGNRMCVISNGYNLSVFGPDHDAGIRLRMELALTADEPVIGFIARYNPQKDHDTLLKSLARLKARGNCPRCLLVGTGMDDKNSELITKIDKLGLQDKVLMLGRRNDIPSVMNALDLHVMSSSSEGFPNVLAEAMACGTPCVSTDVGDAAVIVGNTGLIVPPRDPEALAVAIEKMLEQRNGPNWPTRCEAASRHIEENFSIEKMVERYHMVWNSK